MPESNIIPVLTLVPDSTSVPLCVSGVRGFRRKARQGSSLGEDSVYTTSRPGRENAIWQSKAFPMRPEGAVTRLGMRKYISLTLQIIAI